MSRFRSKGRTRLYDQAVAALVALADSEGPEATEQAVAEVISTHREEAFPTLDRWRTEDGPALTRMDGVPSICKLKQRLSGSSRREYGSAKMPTRPPSDDHQSMWYSGDRPYCYVSQPYTLKVDLQKIVNFSNQWELDVILDPSLSWWYPGRTVALIYRDREVVKRERAGRIAVTSVVGAQ